ncbi:Retrovirus-related Pol polyprotein from transposon TNT 1-94 [Capsicum baccatum]|uniref:Retrovirus-related Pol polyprotein from transposon TNT 1-94 n=1 Tax=Capsicum baccatum TaxID=33114 RepID=A0A2G2VFW0_CAPBA|nr:Retrovirus-related Pol polyprotein from transposon TNT 1-94 [Capsicum baccatum]
MKAEIDALESNNTWKVISLPEGKKVIGCKWVFRIKYKDTREVERFKVRLVAKGFSQQERIDYQETFSPVAKMVIVRSILALASIIHWHIHQIDVYNTFLQGDLYDEIYMELPQEFKSQGEKRHVCRILKSLYGLKQAPRQWNMKLLEAIL